MPLSRLRTPMLLLILILSLAALLLIDFVQAGAQANVFYVSPTGSDSNPGTIEKPWRNLSHAITVARAGDTIFMRGGTYIMGEVWIRGDRGMGGQPGQLLTIKAYPGETPVLQPGTRRMIINADYIRVEGLHFIMPWNMDAFGKGLEIVNNTFTGDQPKYGAITTGGADILIEGNSIQLTPGGNTMDHGIYVKSGQRITLRNNTISGFMGYGIHIYDEHKTNDPNDWAAHPIVIRDILVEGNIVRGSSQRAGIIVAYGTNRGVEYITLENVTIRNNLFLNNATSGVLIRQGENIEISHNTIYRNGQGIDLSGGQGISVRNNIVQARNVSSGAHLRAGGANGVTATNNLYWPGPAQVTGTSDPGAVVADPQFVNPGAGDFHLRSSSPAIDAGVTLSMVTSDFEGTQRPQGAGWDIGADEFGNGGSTPTFADVPFSHWAHDEIETLYQAGYVSGCSTDPLMYCPDATMTRAESAVFVERGIHGAGYLPPVPSNSAFADVLLSEWYAKWTNGLYEDGYTSGCGTDPLIYCPLQAHTRTEGTVFFLRMLNGAEYVPPDAVGIFDDIDPGFWGAKWVEAAYSAGLIPACETSPELLFCPDDPLDRAMAAYMMVQAKELEIP